MISGLIKITTSDLEKNEIEVMQDFNERVKTKSKKESKRKYNYTNMCLHYSSNICILQIVLRHIAHHESSCINCIDVHIHIYACIYVYVYICIYKYICRMGPKVPRRF